MPVTRRCSSARGSVCKAKSTPRPYRGSAKQVQTKKPNSKESKSASCLLKGLQNIDPAANFDELCLKKYPTLPLAYYNPYGKRICCASAHKEKEVVKMRRHMAIMAQLIRSNSQLEPVRKKLLRARANAVPDSSSKGSWRNRLMALGDWVAGLIGDLVSMLTTSAKVFARKHPRAFFVFIVCVALFYLAPAGAASAVISFGDSLIELLNKFLEAIKRYDWHKVAVKTANSVTGLLFQKAPVTVASASASALGGSTVKAAATRAMAAASAAGGTVAMGAALAGAAVVAPVALPVLQFAVGEFEFVEWFFS